MLYGIDRLRKDPMSRTVVLIEVTGPDEFDGDNQVSVVEIRQYDMSDHEQCAIQFVRELVYQGRTPDPECQKLIVIGGPITVKPLPDTSMQLPLQEVPYTVWTPVPPPPTPMWGVKTA